MLPRIVYLFLKSSLLFLRHLKCIMHMYLCCLVNDRLERERFERYPTVFTPSDRPFPMLNLNDGVLVPRVSASP